MRNKLGKFILAATAGVLAVIVALVVLASIFKPGPAGKIVLAAGGSGGAFLDLAEQYKRDLAQYGVTLDVRSNVEGTDTLRGLLSQYRSEFKSFDSKSADIEAGFAKGGVASSLQGRYASTNQQMWHDRQVNDLRSLGRLFYEPLWVFVRADDPIKSLRDLKGKKIIVGSPVTGSRSVSRHILKSNGLVAENTTLIEQELPNEGLPLVEHQADAAMMFLPAESPKIQALLRNRNLRLMDFSVEAEAYTFRFPALTKVVLRQGAVEFNPDIPTADVTLLATSVALIVKTSLNPSLQLLLAHAALAHPKSGFDKTGEPVLFYNAGQFPNANDPEYEVPAAVRQLYKTGELPTLLRAGAIGLSHGKMPFWPAAFLNEHGTQTALFIIPALSILLPLFHYLPIFYKWGVRQRLLNRYQQLKVLEASIGPSPSQAEIAEILSALDRIDATVRRISVPLPFSDQLYDLRGHIDLVRRRLEMRPEDGPRVTRARTEAI